MQGHQNVGELRPPIKCLQINCSNCRVTRMLVSYDSRRTVLKRSHKLQGHQNVGELRHWYSIECNLSTNCRVTRMLVSYDLMPFNKAIGSLNCMVTIMLVGYDVIKLVSMKFKSIAWSPECWWVTTSQLLQCILVQLFCLQNVGSLRNCNDCVHPMISRYESTQ